MCDANYFLTDPKASKTQAGMAPTETLYRKHQGKTETDGEEEIQPEENLQYKDLPLLLTTKCAMLVTIFSKNSKVAALVFIWLFIVVFIYCII